MHMTLEESPAVGPRKHVEPNQRIHSHVHNWRCSIQSH